MRITLHDWLLAAGAVCSFALGMLLYPTPDAEASSQEKKQAESAVEQDVEADAPAEASATVDSEPIDAIDSSDDSAAALDDGVEPAPSDEETPEDVAEVEEETPEVAEDVETDDASQPAETETSEDDEPEEETQEEEPLPENVEPLQQVFPPRVTVELLPNRSMSVLTSVTAHLRQRVQNLMQKECDRIEKDKPCEQRQLIVANRWSNPETLYKEQAARLLQLAGKASEESCISVLERPAGRHMLMQTRLLVGAGFDGIRGICQQEKGALLLEQLSGNEDWLSDLLYSGPTPNLSTSLSHLTTIYQKYADDMAQAVLRRMATAVALEFAAEGARKDDMLARYELYRTGFTEGKLNSYVKELPCWQLRYVMSMPEAQKDACSWGAPKNLAWLRDNVKLPMSEYPQVHRQLRYQLRNVAGDSVYSTDYLAPGLRHADFILAKAQRDTGGGASGAQSHYAAYAAAAGGIPAVIVSEPGHYSYAVRTLQGWQASNSQHWNRLLNKTLWGEPTWGFLQLSDNIHGNRAVSRTADLMLSMADFLTEQEKVQQAGRLYEAVLHYQPTHWPALVRYAAFLKDRAPKDAKKWHKLHEFVLSGIGKRNYQCAAQYLVDHVYPGFLPHVSDAEKRVKLFEKLFEQFNGWGGNRWDIAPLLTAQVESFKSEQDKEYYLKSMFDLLMKKQAYSSAVLIWGLEYMSRLQEAESPFCDEVEKVLTLSLRRSKGGSKHADATWPMLGEVCHSAAKNRDVSSFQLAGDMAYKRCRNKFPEEGRLKLPTFDGFLCSASGLVDTHGAQTTEQQAQACLHWAVLQPFGGSMPVRFENKQGILAQLKKSYELSAVLCVFSEEIAEGRDFYMEISDDGRTWLTEPVKGEITDNMLQFVLPRRGVHARFVRVLREGDRSEATITHLQIYGK